MINNRGEQQPNVESLNTITLAEIHQLYEEEIAEFGEMKPGLLKMTTHKQIIAKG